MDGTMKQYEERLKLMEAAVFKEERGTNIFEEFQEKILQIDIKLMLELDKINNRVDLKVSE